MSLSIPPGFNGIDTARSSSGVTNVIGVAVDVLPMAPTGGTSHVVTFTLKDTDLNGNSWNGLKVKYFNDQKTLLPDVQLHDVVLLRNLRMKLFKGQMMGVAAQYDHKVAWVLFRKGYDSDIGFTVLYGPKTEKLSEAEEAYVKSLLALISSDTPLRQPHLAKTARTEELSSSQNLISASKLAPFNRRQLVLLEDAKPATFVDLICIIVKTWNGDYEKYTIYVTDYTRNTMFIDYGEGHKQDGDPHGYMSRVKQGWRGPPGQMSLMITLWEPHASFARENLKVSDVVYLENVHMKMSRMGGSILEAALHTDRRNPEKISIRKLEVNDMSDARVVGLLRRKQEFWRTRGEKDGLHDEKKQKVAGKKRKRADESRKNERNRKIEEGQVLLKISERKVAASHPEKARRSIDDILDSEIHDNISPDGVRYRFPFQNLCYRPMVRAVDFFPPLLEDFAVRSDDEPADSDGENDNDDQSSHGSNGRTSWEWRFCLLVEDAAPSAPGQTKARMKVFVSGKDADHLLKLDAADLRAKKNERTLLELKQRLFILWGDLQEQKEMAAAAKSDTGPAEIGPVSNVPFNCCIKEYGVRCSHTLDTRTDGTTANCSSLCEQEGCFGFERRFAMFGTTIYS